MSNTLSVRLAARKSGTESWFEGTVSIAGLKPTKLARRVDGSTQFPTKSAVSGAARNLAKSLGFSDVDVTDGEAQKVAAKKAATSKKATSSKKTAVSKTVAAKTAAKTTV